MNSARIVRYNETDRGITGEAKLSSALFAKNASRNHSVGLNLLGFGEPSATADAKAAKAKREGEQPSAGAFNAAAGQSKWSQYWTDELLMDMPKSPLHPFSWKDTDYNLVFEADAKGFKTGRLALKTTGASAVGINNEVVKRRFPQAVCAHGLTDAGCALGKSCHLSHIKCPSATKRFMETLKSKGVTLDNSDAVLGAIRNGKSCPKHFKNLSNAELRSEAVQRRANLGEVDEGDPRLRSMHVYMSHNYKGAVSANAANVVDSLRSSFFDMRN